MVTIILIWILIISITYNLIQIQDIKGLENDIVNLWEEQVKARKIALKQIDQAQDMIMDQDLQLEKITKQLEKARHKRNEYRVAKNYAQNRVDTLEVKYAEATGEKTILCGRKFKN